MKQLLTLLVTCLLFLAACGSQPAQSTTTPTTPATSPAETVPATQPSGLTSTISNVQQQTGAYRSGNTINIPVTITSSGFDPRILTVGYGDRVKLTITNDDKTVHSFDVTAYRIAQTIEPGQTVLVDFYSDVKGEFPYDDRYASSDGTLIVGGKT